MKVAFELEFPDEQAADVFRWLQDLPAGLTIRWKQLKAEKYATSQNDLSEAEQAHSVDRFVGSWQTAADGAELAQQIREALR